MSRPHSYLRAAKLDALPQILLDRAFEWTVGFGIPVLVAGVFCELALMPVTYTASSHENGQTLLTRVHGLSSRKDVDASMRSTSRDIQSSRSGHGQLSCQPFRCFSTSVRVDVLLTGSHLPASAARILFFFYRHSREANTFLQTNGSISRPSYFRLLILGSLDILLTLPVGIIHLENEFKGLFPGFKLKFYDGWRAVHSNWGPASVSYSLLVSVDGLIPAWFEIALAIVIFALFGLTADARATYRQIFYAVGRPFGLKPPVHGNADIGTITFRPRQDTTGHQIEYALCYDCKVNGNTDARHMIGQGEVSASPSCEARQTFWTWSMGMFCSSPITADQAKLRFF
jgi:hypothetical protein